MPSESEHRDVDSTNASAHDPIISRDAIVSAVMAFLAAQDAQTLEDVRLCLDRELDHAGAVYPVGEERLNPVKVIAHVGQPARSGVLRRQARGDRRTMMDAIGLAIANLLPERYRGVYGQGDEELDAAREVAREVFGIPT
jgi:hypothetical protein